MASLALFATAFRIHPCRHPVIGYLDVFNATTRDQVMAYYKARYIPNNMFFVVVGDVHGEEVRAELEKHFAASQRVSLAPVFHPAEPPQLGRREQHEELSVGTE
jgi:zinc protease